LEIAANIYPEVCVVKILLIDPERQEQVEESLKGNDDLREPWDLIPEYLRRALRGSQSFRPIPRVLS